MNHELLKNLNISNVSLVHLNPHHLNIHFSIEENSYMLRMEKRSGRFIPDHVFHTDVVNCCICEDDELLCHDLIEHNDVLFQYLITFPSIRMEWLYL